MTHAWRVHYRTGEDREERRQGRQEGDVHLFKNSYERQLSLSARPDQEVLCFPVW
jgi:hypothetical protein